MDFWNISSLLCARICHDLSGVVGAAAAGVELLQEARGNGEPAGDDVIDFVAAAADGAVSRVRFLRLALGPAAANGHASDSVRDMVAHYLSTLGDGEATLGWQISSKTLSGAQTRILANVIVLVGDILGAGEEMILREDGDHLLVVVSGAGRGLDDGSVSSLISGKAPETAKSAQAFLLRSLLLPSVASIRASDEEFRMTAPW